ncbi:hypothetical protein PCYB_142600 [Plasmodium cynomolgi strain B]|uniref:Uncharacterized protein n=1 Tax=Plasmodium cynomolgi (strain B) TaxID=1120755 RepID=K6VHI9_PLACD|nr:hypothetical protein PCYB_142600 [Plasmodium cynomolgi strain B]GAB68832.1 hypothetical protein PCYB_142600 [Plasmodium cynomolgi strain B]
MKAVAVVTVIALLFRQSAKVSALRIVKGGLSWLTRNPDEKRILTNRIENYKNEVEAQQNDNLTNEVDYQLNELIDVMRLVGETQEQQKRELYNLFTSLEVTKDALLKMLSEYENRIDQLEYIIMDTKKYDPYMERFNYPISKYWLQIDLLNFKSLWKYQKRKHFTSIVQPIEMTSVRYPSSILLLRHHIIAEGFINVEMLQKAPSSSLEPKINQSASGIVFDFVDAHNFRFVQLSFLNDQAVLSVEEVNSSLHNKILSKGVEAHSKDFNTLTCEFVSRKMNVFLNYKKVIEVDFADRGISGMSGGNTTIHDNRHSGNGANRLVGLFTKSGTSEFRNFLTGTLQFEHLLNHALIIPDKKDISTGSVTNSYRFSNRESKDDLSVYTIPYTSKDYDDYKEEELTEDVYPTPESNSYYDGVNITGHTKGIISPAGSSNELTLNTCEEYRSKKFNLTEWISDDSTGEASNSWKVISQFGIKRIIFRNNYKYAVVNSTLIYKKNVCNSIRISSYIKIENDSEAGLLFRHDNRDNMYTLTISSTNREVILKRKKNNIESVIKSAYVKSINSFQRHHLLVRDTGEQGNLSVSLDGVKLFSLHGENYFNSGRVGFFVEHGHAAFDTFIVEQLTEGHGEK